MADQASDGDRHGGAWQPGKLAENTDALSDWVFFTDPQSGEADGPDTMRPVIIRLRSGDIAGLEARIAGFAAHVSRQVGPEAVGNPRLVVPAALKATAADGTLPGRSPLGAGERGDDYFTVLVNADLIRLMAWSYTTQDALHPKLDMSFVTHGAPLPDDAVSAETPRAAISLPSDKAPQDGVVITAVIDSGLPLLNSQFQDARGNTRVAYAWVQDNRGRVTSPSFVPYGREYESADLNNLILAYSANGPYLDEVAAYRRMNLANFKRRGRHVLGRPVTHGAHVASLATGYPPSEDRTDTPIIFVQLPQDVTADTSGASLAPHLNAALDYIADRADRIADRMGCGRLPLVINFSYGGIGGPLDGTGQIEQRIDAFLTARNAKKVTASMVLPAGNGNLTMCHARYVVGDFFKTPGAQETLDWRIVPDDHTANFTEIWTPKGPQADRMTVSLTPPGGTPSPAIGETDRYAVTYKINDQVVAKLSYEYIGAPTNRGRFTIAVQATAKPGAHVEFAPSGTWAITMTNTGLAIGDQVDAWVLRDDELPGYDTDARQSRFTDKDYVIFNKYGGPQQTDIGPSPIRREGLQNNLATGKLPIVVGGYVEKSGQSAPYTAGGLTDTPDRPGPDVALVSDNTAVQWGVYGSGVLSGSRVLLNGTSVAAPQMARALCQAFRDGKTVDRKLAAAMAAQSEAKDFPHRGPKPTVERAGAGRIETAPQSDQKRYVP